MKKILTILYFILLLSAILIVFIALMDLIISSDITSNSNNISNIKLSEYEIIF